jgi:filamentous hemagglutinin family protein
MIYLTYQLIFFTLFSLFSGECIFCYAQQINIVADDTFNTKVSYENSKYTIKQGTKMGSNLFHSFDVFNLDSGETAYFDDTGISNTISRVTGNVRSTIYGRIESNADNFYLINPNGILFGKDSQLAINGSFYASTAHYINFVDGVQLYTNKNLQTLSTAPLSGFGFLDTKAVQPIAINHAELKLNTGSTFTLTGAGIDILQSKITISAGKIYLCSMNASGEYLLNKDNISGYLDEFERYSDIKIDNSILKISKDSSDSTGKMWIESDNITLNISKLTATHHDNIGGDIRLFAKNNIVFENESKIITAATGESITGKISINAKKIYFDNSGVSCHASHGAMANDFEINAQEFFYMKDTVITASAYGGSLNAANINIQSTNVALENSTIKSETYADVQGGNISFINAREIALKNSGITTESKSASKNANGGNIQMTGNIDNISLLDSTISTSVENGIGNAGHILIENAQSVVLNKSKIITQADEGYGGDIYIVSETFIQSSDSLVDDSSRLGVDGEVSISPDERVGQDLNDLTSKPLDHTKWLDKKCTQCSEKNNNSIVYQYADGVPVPLDDWQSSPILPFQADLITDSSDIKQGERLFKKGHFKEAIQLWYTAMNPLDNCDPFYPLILLYISKAYQHIGKYYNGISTLARSIPDQANVTSINDFIQKYDQTYYPNSINALIFNQVSDFALIHGDIQNAEKAIAIALQQAQSEDNPYILACVYNNKGNVLIEKQRNYEALICYENAIKILKTIDALPSWMIQSKVLLNWIRLNTRKPFYDQPKIQHTLDMAIDIINKLDDTHQKSSDLITLGLMIQHDDTSAQLFQHALTISTINKDNRTQSLATGLANDIVINRFLSENTNNAIQTAHQILTQNHKAMFYAQSYPEIQYLWQWQRAKVLKHLHKKKINNELFNNVCPLKSYEHALEILTPVKSCFLNGFHSTDTKRAYFKKHIRALYMELIEGFLDKPKPEKMDLNNALTLLEKLKESEIDNYFDDECLVYLQKLKNKTFGNTPKMISFGNDTAIIYPIDLEDQWIVFMATGDAIDFTRIKNKNFIKRAQDFLASIQSISDDYTGNAVFFYDRVIRPFEKQLKDKTVLIVPDGIFRTIPFAAMLDKQTGQFLIDKYPLSILPSRELVNAQPSNISRLDLEKSAQNLIMINGLYSERFGASSLKFVKKEVEIINELTGGYQLLNEDFTKSIFSKNFQNNDFSIIHIATHGMFDSYAGESFIQAYDSPIHFNDMESILRCVQYRDNQIELLTLSACQTATGDEWAAMGLAGVTLQAGIKSAIASFWSVNDKTTYLLMKSFYQYLFDQSDYHTKAKAIQKAQQDLKNESDYTHPYYWAGFLLIGNWL